ncbi:8458_t:CDS:2 [Ambispora leptoticha]|uniref:8458_t:CDS:1 n=1 Tax=Ambispora leptoticha TaxID=144679 RepID=A0A9N9AB29_9GLOM|nr:8458_t:CDS:2 [Ambispora leptoticha]
MSLDETNLHILATSGNTKERQYAARIQPIRKNGHLLLVTLLLFNVLVNETLPIIMDDIIGGGIMAILLSSALIVIFGEIIPQAVCSRHGLAIGAFFARPVGIFIWIMFIISYPIAKLLDAILGKEKGVIYRRAELKELIKYHESSTLRGGDLVTDTVTIMRGAIDLQEKIVENALTPIEKSFLISYDAILDQKTLEVIVRTGHSRIPVYKGTRDNIIGVLLTKSLILYNPHDAIPLRKHTINKIPTVEANLPLFEMLNIFQEGRSHIAIVVRSKKEQKTPPIGIITLEDVLEELIQEEIYDETDKCVGLTVRVDTGSKLILANTTHRTSTNDPISTIGGEGRGRRKFRNITIRSRSQPVTGPRVNEATPLLQTSSPHSAIIMY